MQYIKDRTESFDDYFPFRIKKMQAKACEKLAAVFVDYQNNELKTPKWAESLKNEVCIS
jgi:putative transposase